MSKIKGQGSSKNNHKTAGKRLGVKRSAGQKVRRGEIIIRQVGMTKKPGPGTYLSRNFSIHAAKDGIVAFEQKKYKRFTDRSLTCTFVSVK